MGEWAAIISDPYIEVRWYTTRDSQNVRCAHESGARTYIRYSTCVQWRWPASAKFQFRPCASDALRVSIRPNNARHTSVCLPVPPTTQHTLFARAKKLGFESRMWCSPRGDAIFHVPAPGLGRERHIRPDAAWHMGMRSRWIPRSGNRRSQSCECVADWISTRAGRTRGAREGGAVRARVGEQRRGSGSLRGCAL